MSLSIFGDLRGPIREAGRPFRGAGTAVVFSFQGVLEGRLCFFFGDLRGPIRESVSPFQGAGKAAVLSFQGVLEGRPWLFLGTCEI